jgi:selenocysteine lyase/cysteine desulfurase
MYAPFGTGTLVGRRDIFLDGAPEYQGGGTVEIVTPTDVHWAELPDREEAGSPNVVGAVAWPSLQRSRGGPQQRAPDDEIEFAG